MGDRYTAVDNCWKRKPKLDYLALKDTKPGTARNERPKKGLRKAETQQHNRIIEIEDDDKKLSDSEEEEESEEDDDEYDAM
eukprot:15358354-Ditylum_brightwellii.AAC.1